MDAVSPIYLLIMYVLANVVFILISAFLLRQQNRDRDERSTLITTLISLASQHAPAMHPTGFLGRMADLPPGQDPLDPEELYLGVTRRDRVSSISETEGGP